MSERYVHMFTEERNSDVVKKVHIKNNGTPQQGIERANRLLRILWEQGRLEDLKRAMDDASYQKQLFREFGL